MPRLRLPPSFADTTSSSSSAASIPSPAPHSSVPRVDPPLHSSMINLGRINCRILKRIPCGSRAPCAEKLSSILDDIVKNNDKEAWNRLFLFSRQCLAQPSRGGHRRSLATCINQAIEREEDSLSNSRQNHSMSLAKRVSAKMEDGDVRGAVRLVSSIEPVCKADEETLKLLQEKHPPSCPDSFSHPLTRSLHLQLRPPRMSSKLSYPSPPVPQVGQMV